MFGLNNKKDMVERPENEPKFNIHNKTDRTILLFVLLGIFIVLAILGVMIFIYFKFIRVN